MRKFIKGQDRSQGTLLPERLDDYVEEDNPVRVIDVFIDHLDVFEAVNSRDRNFTRAKMKRRLRDVELAIERYLAQFDQADRTEPSPDDARTLQDKVARLGEEMARLKRRSGATGRRPARTAPSRHGVLMVTIGASAAGCVRACSSGHRPGWITGPISCSCSAA
jgi:hypothetical protein